jgi:hypothetical protein
MSEPFSNSASQSCNAIGRHQPIATLDQGQEPIASSVRACGIIGRTSADAFAAGGADEVRLDVREPHIIGPAVGADLDMVAAAVIAAIDLHIADAGCAQFAECDFLRVRRPGRHLDRPLVMARDADIDAALLDVNVNGQDSFVAAEILSSRHIPFVFTPGYGSDGLADRFRGVPTLTKPYQRDDLQRALRQGMAGTGNCSKAASPRSQASASKPLPANRVVLPDRESHAPVR